MTNIITVTFPEESAARAGVHKLDDLEVRGDLVIYGQVLLRKENGETEILQTDSVDGWRTVTGMLLGGSIGVIGGPLGFVVGMAAGSLAGSLDDDGHLAFAVDFVDKVKTQMAEGSVVLVAEVEEEIDRVVDTSMRELGGSVLRVEAGLQWDRYEQEQIAALDAEIARAQEELQRAAKETKEKIEAKIADLNARRTQRLAEATASLNNQRDKLQEQAGKVKDKWNTAKENTIKKIASYREQLRGPKTS